MADIFKQFVKHMDGARKGAIADAAAKAMAKSCDQRIAKAKTLLTKIAEHAEDGQNGSARYAQDRLTQIRKVAELGLKRL